jgi:hypothetical protein
VPKIKGPVFHVLSVKVVVDPGSDQYAVSADGHRFLINVPFDAPEQTQINVVLNWPALLTKP